MMKRLRLNRPFCLTVLAITGLLFLSYFPLANIRAASSGATILPSSGKPLVNLKNPQSPKITFTGSLVAVAALQAGTANPTALASADFNSDGAMDVVTGYSTKNGGALVLMLGNPDAYAPTDSSLYAKAMKGQVPPTFLPKAAAYALPESPDFIVTGDFNRDGYKDVLVGARGGALYFLAGDGRGSLLPPQPVALADQVVALAATPAGQVAVSTDGRSGPQVTILAPGTGGLNVVQTYSVPESGTSLEFGMLGGGIDLAVGAGSNIVVIYNALSPNAQTETVSVPLQVQALTLGDFIWDRDGRTEIAALAGDGSIHILQHGTLDTRPVTAADVPARRKAMRRATGQHVSNPTALGAWTVAKQLAYTGSAPVGPMSSSAFSSPGLAASSTHDVMVIDATRSQLNILDTSGKSASPSAGVTFSGTPVAALALPQKIDSGRDIVVLTSAQVAPMLVVAGPQLSFNVNTTADEDDVNACATNSNVTTPPATLSLREAVCIANNNGASTVTINLPAGTYDLAISTFGGNGSGSSSPELQVGIQSGNNITIAGAGASSTLIQQTALGSRIIEADEELNGNMPLVIQNLSLQLGNCTDSGLDCLDNGGGAILAGGATGDTLALTNDVFNDNSTQSSSGTLGGAVEYTGSSLSITGCTFSNNTASGKGGAQGGGVQVANIINGSGVSGSVTITNSIFSGNSASSGNDGNANGGGLFFEGSAGFNGSVTGSTFTGNTASSTASTGAATGGGINAEGGGTDTFSVGNSRIAGNSVSASSAVARGYYGVDLDGTITNNWWGCNGGPGASGCDTVFFDQSGGGSSTFTPWLVLSIGANPTSIATGQTSTLTADLTHDSGGNGGFSVPDGTPVTFGGTLDSSINPTSTATSGGQATSTYTAGNTPGMGSGTATVDNQPVSVTINIGTPPTITSGNSTTFTVGVFGTFTVTTTGSPTPSISESGTLPNGVGFHDNGNGTGTLSGTPTQAGTFNTITFAASNGFAPNATQDFTLTVNKANSSTSVAVYDAATNTPWSGTEVAGASAYAVSAVSGSGPTPTGTVTYSFYGNGTCSGGGIGGNTVTLTPSGFVPNSSTFGPLSAGTYSSQANYSGDSNYNPSTSSCASFSVSGIPTSISVTSVTPSSEVYGQDAPATITAILSWSGSGPAPTGTVTISGNGPSGTYGTTGCGAPSGDTITCTNTYIPTAADGVGTYTESATYSGDSNYSGSSSTQTNNFSITQAGSNTYVMSSQNPSVVGQQVTFTATIVGEYGLVLQRNGASLAGGASGIKRGVTQRGVTERGATERGVTQRGVTQRAPNQSRQAHPLNAGGFGGTVTWSANTGCAPTPVSGDPGTAQCITTTLPQGTDTITATYSGDSNHSGSSGTLAGGQVVNAATVNVTVGTSPAGLMFSVDSVNYTSTQNFTWNIGDMHTIATTSPQFPSAGTQETFASWSDGGAISHSVTATASTTSYTASFNATYQLTTAANPANGGTVMPPSGNYYSPNQVVNLMATANANYAFSNWTGNVANPNSSSTTVTMSGPQSVTANFVTGQVTVSPSSLNFGKVIVNRSGKKVVTVTNHGASKVQIGPITLTVTMGDPSQFTIDHDCTPELRPGKSCLIGIRFTPDAIGPDAATLNIVTSAPGSPIEVPITAAGIAK